MISAAERRPVASGTPSSFSQRPAETTPLLLVSFYCLHRRDQKLLIRRPERDASPCAALSHLISNILCVCGRVLSGTSEEHWSTETNPVSQTNSQHRFFIKTQTRVEFAKRNPGSRILRPTAVVESHHHLITLLIKVEFMDRKICFSDDGQSVPPPKNTQNYYILSVSFLKNSSSVK